MARWKSAPKTDAGPGAPQLSPSTDLRQRRRPAAALSRQRLTLFALLGCCGLATSARGDSFDIVGSLASLGQVKIPGLTAEPSVYFQATTKDIHVAAPAQPAKRVPVHASTLIDVREDASELLCLYNPNSGNSTELPAASYEVNLTDFSWRLLPRPPDTTGLVRPRGYTPGGRIYGNIAGQSNLFWLLNAENTFTLHTWTGAGSVSHVGAEGGVLVGPNQWWTVDQGARALPIAYQSHPVAAVSEDGRWLVTFESHPSEFWLNRLRRWRLDDAGELEEPQTQLLRQSSTIDSIARVLNDGTVFVTLKTQSGSEALRDMDAHIWPANGRLQRLVAAEAVATLVPDDWPVLGRIYDVSQDGRWIAGARERPESKSLNEKTDVWLLCLAAPPTPPPVADALQLRTVASGHDGGTFSMANFGNTTLHIDEITFAGDDASRFTLSSLPAYPPFDLPAGETLRFGYKIQDPPRDAHARVVIRLTGAQAGEVGHPLEHLSATMPRLRLGVPTLLDVPVTAPSLAEPFVRLAVGRTTQFRVRLHNTSSQAAENCRLRLIGADGLELSHAMADPFMVPASSHVDLEFTGVANQEGEFTPRVELEPVAGFRLESQGDLRLRAVTPHELTWPEVVGAPTQHLVDVGDIPVGGWGEAVVTLQLAVQGTPLNLWHRNSRDASAHAYLRNGWTSGFPPMQATWLKSLAAQSSGSVDLQVALSPQMLGWVETTLEIDAPGAAAPMTLRVVGNGISESASFLEEPTSAILRPGEPYRIRARAVSLFSLRDTLSQASLTRTGPDEFSFHPGDGTRRLHLDIAGQPPLLSGEFRVARLNGGDPFAERRFETGQSLVLTAPSSAMPMVLEWLKDGEPLAASAQTLFSGSKLFLTALTAADAGDYACRFVLQAPEGEITRTIPITRAIWIAPPVPPRVTPFSLRPARAGEFIQFQFTSDDPVDQWLVQGLPPGLTAQGPQVQGFLNHRAAPTAPRFYRLRVQAVRGGVFGPVYVADWLIEPFADAWLAGVYHGVLERGGIDPEGGSIKVTLTARGSGTFAVQGGRTRERGSLFLAGRGPAEQAANYDPPLPQGLDSVPQAIALIGLGPARRDRLPALLILAVQEGVLAGSLSLTDASGSSPVLAFKQTRPPREFLQAGPSTRYSLALRTLDAAFIWRNHPQGPRQPGRSPDALQFADSQGRLHLVGSHNPSHQPASDHWIWDPVTCDWIETTAAGFVSSPRPPVGRESVVWPRPAHGDSWVFTRDGGLWRWREASLDWQKVQSDLPAFAPGHPGSLGLAGADNRPRGRTGATAWVTGDGSLWMFGGLTRTSTHHARALADLWRYQPETGLWTWMAGRVSLPEEGADWRSDGVLEPGPGHGPGWVDAEERLWLHQGLSQADLMWCFDPATAAWNLVSRTEGPHLQPGLGNNAKRVLEAPETGTSPGEREIRALTWTGADGSLYLFGGRRSQVDLTLADFYVWRYAPDARHWVCDGYQSAEFNAGRMGYGTAQAWRTAEGRVYLRGGVRQDWLNQADPLAGHLFEHSPHPVQQVPGFLTVQMSANGSLKWSGRLPDHQPLTGAGGLSQLTIDFLEELGLPRGTWMSGLFSVLGRTPHTCLGLLGFDQTGFQAGAQLSWRRPSAATTAQQRLLQSGFPVTLLAGAGWRHDPVGWKTSLPTEPLPMPPTAELDANSLSLGLDPRGRLTAAFATWQPDKLKVSYNAATGLLTLKGSLTDPSTSRARPWNLQGLLLPAGQQAVGQHTLPARQDASLLRPRRATDLPIHLGGFDTPSAP